MLIRHDALGIDLLGGVCAAVRGGQPANTDPQRNQPLARHAKVERQGAK